jgi:DNA-binding NtrC family response regulator
MPQIDEDREDRPLAGKRILLAEDEERLRTIMAMMIEELGAEVTTLADGKSAINSYIANRDEIDLVILDIRMAGLSGASTFKQLLEIDPDVKVVLSSGIWPDDELVDLLFANKGGFVEKPFNLEKLALVLTTVLDGKPMIRKL